MKRIFIYTAVFSAMMLMTGCGGGNANQNQSNNTGLNNTGNNQNTDSNTNQNQNNSGSNNTSNNNQNTGNNTENQQIAGDVWIVKGRVQDTDNRIVENAKVSVLLENTEYSTKSNKNGEYTLKLPQDFKYPEHLSGIIHAEGYKPTTLLLSYKNKELYIDQESNNPIMKKMQEQDVIFFNGLKVIHLGDDAFGGNANSQFQVKAQGIIWKDSFTYSAAKKAKYDEICISLMGKGIQTDNRTLNTISLSKSNQTDTIVTQPLKASSDLGEYSNLEHCFSLQNFNTDEQIYLSIKSHNGVVNYDDFEMINIEGVFRNSGNTSGSSSNSSGSNNNSGGNTESNNNSGSNTGSNSNSGSSNNNLCITSTTAEGKMQCVGKDNINYLFGGFNSYSGNVAGYMDNQTTNMQTATSCSVTRSGNTLTLSIPSLGVSGTVTAEALQVITLTAQDAQFLYFLTGNTSEKFGDITNMLFDGVVISTAAVVSGGKTYTCAKY